MSSLARRTLRTTAAAAGIAALGAGLAGNAVAAPSVDPDAAAPEAVTGVPAGLPSLPLAELPSAPAVPNVSDLPMLFVFQGPTVRTAGPAGDAAPSTRLPGVEQIPGSDQVPGLDAVPTPDPAVPTGALSGDLDGVRGVAPAGVALPVTGPATEAAEADAASSTPARVGALSALDSAGLFAGLPEDGLVDQQGLEMSTDRPGAGLS